MNMIDNLLPKNQNNIQRGGLALVITLSIITIFLHNPIDGYSVEQTVDRSVIVSRDGCPRERLNELRAKRGTNGLIGSTEDFELNRLENQCEELVHRYDTETLPLTDWSSRNPIFGWFGPILHTIWAVFLLAVVGALWIWMFKNKNESGDGR